MYRRRRSRFKSRGRRRFSRSRRGRRSRSKKFGPMRIGFRM